MNRDENIQYWIDSSDSDAETMRHLFVSGDYSWSLFLSHIVIEKLLKACYVKAKAENPPLLHDLARIALRAGLDLSTEKMDLLDTVTTFNLRARYDDYRREFSKRCTREFADSMIREIEELRVWIKNKL